jgi:hypothetical protein
MRERWIRLLLAVLAFSGLGLGAYATIAPRHYFVHFPGAGHQWVAADGPYNEHLMRDYGALNLGLGVVAACAIVWLTRPLVIATALGWLAYDIPHLLYHLFHRDVWDTADQVGALTALLVVSVVCAVLLGLSRSLPARQ